MRGKEERKMEAFERYGFSVGRESAVVNIPEDIKVIEDGALCGLKKLKKLWLMRTLKK